MGGIYMIDVSKGTEGLIKSLFGIRFCLIRVCGYTEYRSRPDYFRIRSRIMMRYYQGYQTPKDKGGKHEF